LIASSVYRTDNSLASTTTPGAGQDQHHVAPRGAQRQPVRQLPPGSAHLDPAQGPCLSLSRYRPTMKSAP
jgi:hypothetical protein